MMGRILTTLGHDPVGMKRATERALGQVSDEFDRVDRLVSEILEKLAEIETRLADHESRISTLEGP